MESDFDIEAQCYDRNFTHTLIGEAQRDRVYYCLDKIINHTSKKILEINCGTGEDVIWLAKFQHEVIATDVSKEMVAISKAKLEKYGVNAIVEQLDSKQLNNYRTTDKFDVIFSNFGGLNCLSISELRVFLNAVSNKLTPEGKLIMVIMPKHCIWDNLFLLLKGRWKELFRRSTKTHLNVNVTGNTVKTWYHNPRDIIKIMPKKMNVEVICPIGFFIPPSYLTSFFSSKPKFIKYLNELEKKITNKSIMARFSDHYLITLTLK